VLLGSTFHSYVMFADAKTMKEKRRFSIGPCVRPVGYDPREDVGYASCFSGQLFAFDVDTGRIIREIQVGPNARQIVVTEELGVLIASECGVMRLRTKK
jgi:hypothetical protein